MRGWFSRYGFWLLLAVVLLLSLPAVVLLLLHLFGQANAVNGWLQDNLGLSYHWPLPLWAALLFAFLPFLLLLLYFLKLKRQALAVPSTFLWRKTIEDTQVNSLFQWLKRNLLLLLQLLTLFALIYSLLNLQRNAETQTGRYYVLLIDNSASMSATDVKPTRLDRAKQEALKEIDARGDGDAGMVIVFNSSASVLQPYTTDRALLRRAVERIEPTGRPTSIDRALDQAAGRANPLRGTDDQAVRPADEDPAKRRQYVTPEGIPAEVHVYSDGGFPDVPEFSLGNLDLRYHPAGASGPDVVNNIGLVGLSYERDKKDPRLMHVLARVRNYRNQDTSVKVQLEVTIGDKLVGLHEKPAGRDGLIPARKPGGGEKIDEPGEGLAHFRLSDVSEKARAVLHAKLIDVEDDFALDDEAWLVAGVARKARVLAVAPTPNRYIDAFLKQVAEQELAAVSCLTPADLADEQKYREPAREGEWDLVVFDRCRPTREEEMPFANTFFIRELPPPWDRSKFPVAKSPPVIGWADKHPLMRDLAGLREMEVPEAFLFDLRGPGVPPRVPRLLETKSENALLFALPRGPFTDLVMAFPLVGDRDERATSWPLDYSFPLFLRNILFTLGHGGPDPGSQPGALKKLRPERGVREIAVQPPRGKSYTVKRGPHPEFPFNQAEQVGVYEVSWAGRPQAQFAVNLLDSRESNLEPRPAFRVGSERVAAGQTRRQPADLWRIVAVVALLLLFAEWYVYNRRHY